MVWTCVKGRFITFVGYIMSLQYWLPWQYIFKWLLNASYRGHQMGPILAGSIYHSHVFFILPKRFIVSTFSITKWRCYFIHVERMAIVFNVVLNLIFGKMILLDSCFWNGLKDQTTNQLARDHDMTCARVLDSSSLRKKMVINPIVEVYIPMIRIPF